MNPSVVYMVKKYNLITDDVTSCGVAFEREAAQEEVERLRAEHVGERQLYRAWIEEIRFIGRTTIKE